MVINSKTLPGISLLLIVLAFVSILWVPHGIEALIGILALIFLFISKGRIRNELENNYLLIFLVSLLATIVLGAVHYKLYPDHVNQLGKTLGKMMLFAGIAFIIDAIAFQFNKLKLSPVKFAKICIWALFLSIGLKIVVVFLSSPEASLLSVIFGEARNAFLAGELNPNRADDLFLVQLSAIIFCLSILISYKKLDWPAAVISAILGCYLFVSFYVTGSRAGQFGFVVGLLLISGFYLLKAKRLVLIGIIIIFVGGLSVVSHSIVPGLEPKFINIFESHGIEYDITDEQIATANKLVSRNADGLRKIKQSEYLRVCMPLYKKRHQTLHPYIDMSSSVRLTLWSDGIKIWQQRPFFGHGEYDKFKLAEEYPFVSRCHMLGFSHIHSFYLDALIRGGVFMLAIYMALFVYLFYLIVKTVNFDNRTAIMGAAPLFYLTFLIVENFFDLTMIANTHVLGFTLAFVVMCGVYFGIIRTEQKAG